MYRDRRCKKRTGHVVNEENNSNIMVTIIGVAPPNDLIANSHSNDYFDILGFVDDVRSFIDWVVIYVYPIMDSGGTKQKMLDVLSMGKVIVALSYSLRGN
ncbi:MAG: glycosyltransferase [Candidatus Thiodiazotropha sp.]